MKVWPSVPGYTSTDPTIIKNINIENKKNEETDVQRMDLLIVSFVSQVKRTARHVNRRMIIINERMRFAP